MLGRPGHPVFTRFAVKVEETQPKPQTADAQADAQADEAMRKSAPKVGKAA